MEMSDKQKVLLYYPGAQLFKSGNGRYVILDYVPMGSRIENESNATPALAWKAAAFKIMVDSIGVGR